MNCTYLDFDDKLGSDIFRRLFRWFLLWDSRSLYDSERFTDTGADFDFVLQTTKTKKEISNANISWLGSMTCMRT